MGKKCFRPSKRKRQAFLIEKCKDMAGKRKLREEREARGEIDPAAVASTSGEPSTLEDMSSSNVESHASDEEELVISIKEEVGETMPVQFLGSTSGLEEAIEAPPPQFNISVAPTNVGTQEAAYSISINEIQDPLQGTSSTVQPNPVDFPPDDDNLLKPAGFITVSGKDLPGKRRREPTSTFDYSQISQLYTKIGNGVKKRKTIKNVTGEKVEVKRNPPRQAKIMTNAQELMNRKLTDIIQAQHKMMKILKEMPEQGEGAARTSSFNKEDRFDICGRHIATLLRELPTFDALALESKIMDMVYKEREKLETFRKSLQSYSALLPPNHPA